MHKNFLIAPILDILKTSEHAIKEYDLIKRLERGGIEFPFQQLSSEVALFRKHFLVMNALYGLQQELIEENLYLFIDPLKIKLEICASDHVSSSSDQQTSELSEQAEHKIREYYLDWNNYEGTSQQDVNNLLSGFWKKYFAVEKKAEALTTLGIDSDVSLDQITLSYRKLAAQHHPDKGGSHERFIEIREAYEILKCCF